MSIRFTRRDVLSVPVAVAASSLVGRANAAEPIRVGLVAAIGQSASLRDP